MIFGSGILLIGGVTFALVLVGILGWMYLSYGGGGSDGFEKLVDAAASYADGEDADALAFIPYSDGPLIAKPAIYDRELLGGRGGYRTEDGERIYVSGQGSGKFSLGGVDVIMAIDPTEHAAAADPLKAHIAQENDLGRWIKTDREGTILEAGEALKSADGITPAMDQPQPQAATDGGYPSEVHKHAADEGMGLDEALAELESEGLIHKIVDLAPPREVVVDEDTGELDVNEATHVTVDVSKAADMLPKKTNTTEWQTMYEKALAEGRDEEKLMEYMMYGVLIGAVVAGVSAAVIALVLGFT